MNKVLTDALLSNALDWICYHCPTGDDFVIALRHIGFAEDEAVKVCRDFCVYEYDDEVEENVREIYSTDEYTWDDIYRLAEGAACRDFALIAKDNARAYFKERILKDEEYDIDDLEIPEEAIDRFALKHKIYFDTAGNYLREEN